MSKKILVTYASRTGSTIGVAEEIGATLEESGFKVDVRPMLEITDLNDYWAVVAGSAIQNKQWLPEALAFVEKYRAELRRKLFAPFLVCMTLSIKDRKWIKEEDIAGWSPSAIELVEPVREGLFAGALDLKKIPSRPLRMMLGLAVRFGLLTEGDHRDWDAIRAWANDLADVFHEKSRMQEAATVTLQIFDDELEMMTVY